MLRVATTRQVLRADDKAVEEDGRQGRKLSNGKIGRIADPILRAAIENYAVDMVIEDYRGKKASEFVKLGKPFDLKLKLAGQERHVEVKGSSMEIATVELTANEVSHAHDFQPTDLAVVDCIRWEISAAGNYSLTGGRLRLWPDWTPKASALAPRKYAYILPPADG